MDTTRLGRTSLVVSRTGFGALPIQRIGTEEAGRLLCKAFDAGINFFDTARGYSDSEEKIGFALSSVREEIVIATKSSVSDRKTLMNHVRVSLEKLKTDYIDIFQLHNPPTIPDPEDKDSAYNACLELREKGVIRFIGISNHRREVARQAITSGLFDTLQFPLSYLSSEDDLDLIEACREADVGVIAMKALSGGIVPNARAAFAFLRQYPNVVPIWGIQRESELEEFLALEAVPPPLDDAIQNVIDKDRSELAGNFCRACGYCQPCPADIPISAAARMYQLLRRLPSQNFLTKDWQEKMERISDCTECGQCRERCPYDLDTPNLLKKQLVDYRIFVAKHANRP